MFFWWIKWVVYFWVKQAHFSNLFTQNQARPKIFHFSLTLFLWQQAAQNVTTPNFDLYESLEIGHQIHFVLPTFFFNWVHGVFSLFTYIFNFCIGRLNLLLYQTTWVMYTGSSKPLDPCCVHSQALCVFFKQLLGAPCCIPSFGVKEMVELKPTETKRSL